ncbi:sensor histidine kinase [Armatimonas rosea]|uniref:histidine kinase n=1 Tax=Armatimonas rosea TaxID=685828 RepID=A0A7W9W9B4_ARMRO|nr:ATP-binding protein [Armatimonas rosea]MBB6052442.1 heavy metal sensor kinase [Armatimonas rosea]
MSVRVRLAVLNVLVFAIVLGALGVMLRVQVAQTLREGVDWQLKRRAQRYVPRDGKYSLVAFERWRPGLAKHIGERRDGELFRYPFYDSRGKNYLQPELSAFDPVALAQAQATQKPVYSSIPGSRCFTVALLTDETNEAVYYQVAESVAPMNEELNRLTRTLLTLIPLALLLAGTCGVFLTGRALAPVRQITDAAARIGVEDLSERMRVPGPGKDEFARLAQTFNGMLERLEAAFERQKRFVADASHELKTPLTVIKANSSLALADPDLPSDYRETLVEIDRAADRTSRLVQDLLLLARTDHAQLPLKENEISAAMLFSAAISEAHKLYPDGATLRQEVSQECFWGDSHLLHRLLLNLLDNALRHTSKEGTVTLSAQPSGFTVTDTGEGIPAEHLAHLGERFYRVDSARARTGGGTGLGLAISRAIVEAHGGTLEIQSEVGKGTTVRVTLAPHE